MILAPSTSYSHFFIFIALAVGLLTVATDIRQKKIYNLHLALGTGLGLVVVCYAVFTNFPVTISHLTNGSLALLIGWLLYRNNIWRGGDAKLFALYAFLMPPIEHETTLFLGAVHLFACSFIIAMIIIMPVFIKNIISNHATISKNIYMRRDALFQGAVTSIVFSWAMFPAYYLARITNPLIIVVIAYFLFTWGYDGAENEAKKHYMLNFLKKKKFELCLIIPFGFLMRLWLAPDSLSWPILIRSILTIGISTTLSACLHIALKHLKEYQDRIPFAPLLFVGWALCYTPFLTWVTSFVRR